MRFLLLTLLILSCGKVQQSEHDYATQFPYSTASHYFQSTAKVEIEVFYEIGAEPFVGNRNNGSSLWGVTRVNMEKAFSYRSTIPNIIIPQKLDEMIQLPAQNKQKWSVDDVASLARNTSQMKASVSESYFQIYFLNGFSDQGNNIIGFNISGTPIIAIFKDVIRTSGGSSVQKFVEQSTVVHEMGHALGLVNNGIPLTSNHQDADNGAHTQNSDCVMYWKNEGSSDLAGFVAKYILAQDIVMWGPEVLSDIEAYSK